MRPAGLPAQETHRWLVFDDPPAQPSPYEVVVRLAHLEDAAKAQQFSSSELLPRVVQRIPIVLNFSGVEICTQNRCALPGR